MGENQYTYHLGLDALKDADTDDQHDYHALYLHVYDACNVCGKPTREACVLCGKPFNSKCLYNIHLPKKRDPNPKKMYDPDADEWVRIEPGFEYSQVCQVCYQDHEQHPPFSWG